MAQCRTCGAAIRFVETPSGKFMPVDPDGTPHFATCSERVRGPRPPDDLCLNCRSTNVERLPGKGPHYGAIHCLDCGQHRWLRRPALVE